MIFFKFILDTFNVLLFDFGIFLILFIKKFYIIKCLLIVLNYTLRIIDFKYNENMKY